MEERKVNNANGKIGEERESSVALPVAVVIAAKAAATWRAVALFDTQKYGGSAQPHDIRRVVGFYIHTGRRCEKKGMHYKKTTVELLDLLTYKHSQQNGSKNLPRNEVYDI